MNWEIRLIGDKRKLERLKRRYKNNDLCVIQKEDNFYLSSPEFKNIISYNELKIVANKRWSSILGANVLFFDDLVDVRIGGISSIDDTGMKLTYGEMSMSQKVEMNIEFETVHTGKNKPGKKKLPHLKCVNLAGQNEDVEHIMRLLIEKEYLDWSELYKIYELVKKNVGNNQLHSWASRRKLKLFTHTANSYMAVGDSARHAVDITDPPKNPMKITSAERLIKDLTKKWLTN